MHTNAITKCKDLVVFILTTSTLKLMFRVFMTPVLFPAAQGPGHHTAREKQVAMIAQKVVDANQTQQERHPFIPSTNQGTTTFRALWAYH
jgi:hypothetical protein